MDSIQNTVVPDPFQTPQSKPHNISKLVKLLSKDEMNQILTNKVNDSPEKPESSFKKYSKEANENFSRHKRAARRDDKKNTCSLYIQTDPLIWRHIRETFPEVCIFFSFGLMLIFFFPSAAGCCLS